MTRRDEAMIWFGVAFCITGAGLLRRWVMPGLVILYLGLAMVWLSLREQR